MLYRTLAKLYEKKEDVRILQQICTLLIKGNKTDIRYFEWYRLGVENTFQEFPGNHQLLHGIFHTL